MAPLNALTDLELMALLKADDHGAFSEIYHRYFRLVVNFTAKRLHDLQAAEDIVQEIFVRLWDNRKHVEINTALGSYLFRSALNSLLNHLRHIQVKQAHVDNLQFYLAKGVADTDHRARRSSLEVIIQREIDLLPPKTKEVFELRRRSQLTNREIAEALSISEQTVETHMKKALKHLRTKLGLVMYIVFLCSR